MVRVRYSELDESVRSFLDQTVRGETIVVENDEGIVQCGITPYAEASSKDKRSATKRLTELQDKAAEAMANQGVTEADLDEELQDRDESCVE